MATLASAKEKYARSMTRAAANYNAAKGRMSANYASGMARFLGAPVSGAVAANYQAGVNAAQYRTGDPDRWAQRLMQKMTGQ